MIKRPSRKLITSSLRSDVPLCVNTFDYGSSDPTDPSVPLPSNVSLTFNAPVKAAFEGFGTSGFTASSNSFGVTTTYPSVPFTIINPVRVQIRAQGSEPTTGNFLLDAVTLARQSDSLGTVFDTPKSSFADATLTRKLINTSASGGFYLRSENKYLLAVYGTYSIGSGSSYSAICLVYSPIKLLPKTFSAVGLSFREGSAEVTDGVQDITCRTSAQVLDLDAPLPSFNTWADGSKTKAIFVGSTSLTFTV